VSVNHLINEGCLFITIVAPVKDLGIADQGASGIAVDLGLDGCMPIGLLTRKFVASESSSFAVKPKVFLILDPNVQTDLSYPPQVIMILILKGIV
jgi:hypothetical protein